MESKGTTVALSGAAVLALLFSPMAQKAVRSGSGSPEFGQFEVVTDSKPLQAHGSLIDDDTGPWYALCREFQNSPTHVDRPASELGHVDQTRIDEDSVEVIRKHTDYDEKLMVIEHPVRRLASCMPDSPSTKPNLRFLIATVPDPLKSHLEVDFDRYVEAIQHAAGANNFDFERYWLPWKLTASPLSNPSANNQGAHESHARVLREDQPGLIIFRKRGTVSVGLPDEWLLVFLVGETPTAGVNRLMFTNAIAYMVELRDFSDERLDQQLFIAGPNFSASYSSLADSILWNRSVQGARLHVMSPSSSAAALIRNFKQRLNVGKISYSYSALEMRTCRAVDDWHRVMHRLGYEDQELAIIGEDESAYGTEVATSDDEVDNNKRKVLGDHLTLYDYCFQYDGAGRPVPFSSSSILHLQFPRDLSSLRNAAEALGQLPDQNDVAVLNLPQLSVPLTLHQEESNDRDSPPSFANSQSPARIDRALQQLVLRLRLQRTQGILITATNPLDLIYLLDYLHQHLPDVRLGAFGADEFMLGRPKSIDLTGTLVVTGMPLLPNYGLTLRGAGSSHVSFPSTNAEAMFLSIADLLNVQDKDVEADSANKSCDSVSVVGKSGFSLLSGRYGQTFPCSGPSPASLEAIAQPIPWVWSVILIVLTVASMWHLSSVAAACGWISAWVSTTKAYILVAASPTRQLKLFYLFILTNQVVLLEWMTVSTTAAMWGQFRRYQIVLMIAHIVLFGLAAVTSGKLLFALVNSIRCGDPKSELWSGYGKMVLCLSCLFPAWTVLMWWLILCNGHLWRPDSAIAFRAAQLTEGLSPLTTIMTILLAYSLWAWNNLYRLTMIESRQVRLSLSLGSALGQLQERLHQSISESIYSTPTSIAIGMGIAACIFRLGYVMRGIDGSWFRWWVVWWGFGSLLLTLLIAFCRVWTVWGNLKRVLNI